MTSLITILYFSGGLLLQALLEHWPRPYAAEEESDIDGVRSP